MEVKDLFSEVKALPIQSVIGKYVELRKKGATFEGLCPFHGDQHYGSFKVNPRKNRWNCYACNLYGDATDFVARFEQISTRDAVFQIAASEGLLSAAEEAELRAGNPIKKKFARKMVQIPENKPPEALHCAEVYKAFANACEPLSEAHKQHLEDVRKIKPEDMGLFFEWPSSSDKGFWRKFSEELRNAGILSSVEEAIKYVPGFAYDSETGHPYFMNGRGIGIKLFDTAGILRGLQLRQDDAKSGSKYKLFSSGWAAQNHLDEPNKSDGASAGQVPDFVLPSGDIRGLAVTEGKFKALQLKRFHYATLSVNGVNSWSHVLPEAIQFAKERGLQEIHIYYDADMETKKGVAGAAIGLAEAIKEYGLIPYFIVWDESLGKGIDDMLLAGHKNALIKRSLEEEAKIITGKT